MIIIKLFYVSIYFVSVLKGFAENCLLGRPCPRKQDIFIPGVPMLP